MSIFRQDYFYKIALVGDSSVGKSSLLKRYCDDHFEETYHATIGVDFKFKTLQIGGNVIKIQIWDTAGQQRFRTITSAYYKNAQGIIISFDILQQNTFASIQKYWLQQIKKYGQEGVQIVVIGNKVDCPFEKNRIIKQKQQFQAKNNIKIFLSSAKTGQNVKEAFDCLIQKCIQKFGANDKQISEKYKFIQQLKKKKSQFKLKSAIQPIKKQKKCC